MAGVESLTKQILLDAEEKAAGILLEARERADQIILQAREEAEKDAADAAEKAESDAADYQERIRSQIGMQYRQTLLKAKQDLIEGLIKEAKDQLENQPSEGYFALLLQLLEKHVRPAEGEMMLSQKDYDRLPEDFSKKVNVVAAKKGGSLRLIPQQDNATRVGSGFVLRYGGIEENCTLEALFQDKDEDLRDAASRVLFAE